jgi:DNA helicase II / ATP-dependent DNA helicase PcrA
MKYNDVAILYRTNAQSGPIQRALVKQGIPYRTQGGMGFFQQREIKDIMSLLSWIMNPMDTISLERASKNLKLKCGPALISKVYSTMVPTSNLQDLNFSLKGVMGTKPKAAHKGLDKLITLALDIVNNDKKAYQALEDIYREFGVLSILAAEDKAGKTKEINREESAQALLEMAVQEDGTIREFVDFGALSSDKEEDDTDAVTLSTIHKSKGLEWPMVFVVGCSDGQLPHKMVYKDIEENYGELSQSEIISMPEYKQERNAMYVALTRAEKYLLISHSKTATVFNGHGREKMKMLMSPFAKALKPIIEDEGTLQLS